MADRLIREWLSAGVAGAIADGMFSPLTVLQVRAQLQPNVGSIQHARSAIAHAGFFRGLWQPGLLAICMRAFSYSGCRVGLYPVVRDSLPGDGVGTRVVAGFITGGLGASLFSPFELVRVRMVGATPYRNTLHAFAGIVKSNGIFGLWCGVAPWAMRAAVYSGTQLASYETAKQCLLSSGMFEKEGLPTQFTASIISGLIAALVVHPLDTFKTVAMDARQTSLGSLRKLLSSVAAEGIVRLYAGIIPALACRGPMVLVFLPLTEFLRKHVFGLEYL